MFSANVQEKDLQKAWRAIVKTTLKIASNSASLDEKSKEITQPCYFGNLNSLVY